MVNLYSLSNGHYWLKSLVLADSYLRTLSETTPTQGGQGSSSWLLPHNRIIRVIPLMTVWTLMRQTYCFLALFQLPDLLVLCLEPAVPVCSECSGDIPLLYKTDKTRWVKVLPTPYNVPISVDTKDSSPLYNGHNMQIIPVWAGSFVKQNFNQVCESLLFRRYERTITSESLL